MRAHVIRMLCASAVLSIVHAQVPRPVDAAAMRAWRERIRPAAPPAKEAGVIAGGSLLLYGQDVPPPFRVVLEQDRLLVNGVQVEPPLVGPWMAAPAPEPASEAAAIDSLARRIRASHDQLRTRTDVRPALRARVRESEPMVAAIEWISAELLLVTLVDGARFGIHLAPSPAPEPGTVRRALEEQRDRIRDGLRAGCRVVIGSSILLTVPPEGTAAFDASWRDALGRRSESGLQQVLLHRELAWEVLAVADGR